MLTEATSFSLQRALHDSASELASGDGAARARVLSELARRGLATLPMPGSGSTLERWQAFATVATCDLALAKLYEGHTDALATLTEAGSSAPDAQLTWGMWAAESPGARVTFELAEGGRCMLNGTKAWCSGAAHLDRALLTVWRADGAGPFLAVVDLKQPGVAFDRANWQAVGMTASDSHDVIFEGVPAELVGTERFYLTRPGFWQGGSGIAACWHAAACAIADTLRSQAQRAPEAGWHRLLALGAIDHILSANAAMLRESAAWIDAHPQEDARAVALRARAGADAAAGLVLQHATRALGATLLCRDSWFARMAADLPVFVRQCHGDRDLVALGEAALSAETPAWTL